MEASDQGQKTLALLTQPIVAQVLDELQFADRVGATPPQELRRYALSTLQSLPLQGNYLAAPDVALIAGDAAHSYAAVALYILL